MADERVQVEISAVDRASQVFTGLGRQLDDLVPRITSVFTPMRLLGGLIGFELASALKSAVDGFTKFALQVRDLSYLSGGSARDVSVLITGLEDLGVESSTVERGMAMMSRAVEAGSPALNRLGISVRDSNGNLKTGLTLFYEVVDALGGMRNEVERNSLARELFSRGWTQMIPVLAMGSAKLRELGEQNAALGKTIDEDGIRAAQEYKIALHELGNAWEGFTTQLVRAAAPALIRTTNLVAGLMEAFLSGRHVLDEYALVTERMSGRQEQAAGTALRLAEASERNAGAFRAVGKAIGETAPELERRIKLETQLAQLAAARATALVAAMPQGMVRVHAELAAAEKAINASRQDQLGKLEVSVKKGEQTEAEAAKLRVGINALADSQIAAARQKFSEGQLQEQIRLGAATTEGERITLEKIELMRAGLLQQTLDINQTVSDQEDISRAYGLQKEAELTAALEVGMEIHESKIERMRQRRYEADRARSREEIESEQFVDAEIERMRTGSLAAQIRRLGDEETAVRLAAERGLISRREADSQLTDIARRGSLLRLQEADDYFDKVRLGLASHVTDWRSADQKILDITKGFADAATRSLDDLFFNVLHGRFKSLTDIAKQFGEQLLRIASQELARSTLSGLFGASGVLGPGGGGGASPAGTALGAAQLAAVTSGGPAGASSGGGGGGLLSPITSLITGATKLPGAITALIEGGPMAAPDKLIGLTPLLKALGLGAQNLTPGLGVSEVTAANLAAELGTVPPVATGGAASLFPTGFGIGEEAAGITGASIPGFATALPVAALALPISMAIGSILGNRAQTKLEAQQNNAIGQWLQQNPAALARALQNLQADVASSPQADVLGRPHQAPRLTIPLVPGMDSNLVLRAMADMFKDRRGIAPGWDALLEYLPKHRLAMTPAGGIMYLGEPNFPGETSADVESLAYQSIARQHGGPVSPGQAYWVGERGPELVIPRQAATVVPTEQARAAGGNVYITIEQRAPILGFEGAREFARFMVAEIRRLGIAMPGVDLFPVR